MGRFTRYRQWGGRNARHHSEKAACACREDAACESFDACHARGNLIVVLITKIRCQTRYSSEVIPQALRFNMEAVDSWDNKIVYPMVARVTAAMLVKPMTDKGSGRTNKAGYADFAVLDKYGRKNTLGSEIKPFWATAYSNRVFEALRSGCFIDPKSEEFKWKRPGMKRKKLARRAGNNGGEGGQSSIAEGNQPSGEEESESHNVQNNKDRDLRNAEDLLKQIWGQLIYSETYWGFATNGSKIILYVRTGEKGELTLSDLMDMTDPVEDILATLAGLAFASVDHRLRPQLPEYLCADSVEVTITK
ncbi:hypothetical protein GY45DRAFT_499150 [Cubamyces sp. BRFM 1775]|nr:hypothetical protein GY45DRAFT_499150 [Cubamyces sp. BRFM 1775]